MLDQASNLRKLMQDSESSGKGLKKAKVITITSGKGGVGKSNLVVNLALALQQKGNKVLIFDADIGMGNDDILLGVFPKHNIYDVILNSMDIKEAIEQCPLGVGLLSGGSGINKIDELSQYQRTNFLKKLENLEEYDYILMDTGAGISRNVMAFIGACDEFIIATTPEPTALTDAYGVLKATKHFKLKNEAQVIVNKCFEEKEGLETYNKLKTASKKFLDIDLSLLGIVLDDKKLEEAVRDRIPVILKYPASKASRGIYALANEVLGTNDVNQKGIGNFFKKLFDVFS